MTRDKFIEKWGNPLFNKESPGQSFASDLDELLKENATDFAAYQFKKNLMCTKDTANEWYDTFISVK